MLGFWGGEEAEREMELKMSSRSSMPAFRAAKSRCLCQLKALLNKEAWASQDETSVFMKSVRVAESWAEAGGGFLLAITT